MKEYGYRNSTDNLFSYTCQVMNDSGWNVKKIGCMVVAYMDISKNQLFNYAFFDRSSGLNEPDRDSVFKTYEFCKDNGLDVAWPIDAHMKSTRELLERELNAIQVSNPWKAFLKIRSVNPVIFGIKDEGLLRLDPANTEEKLREYAGVASDIFGHGCIDSVSSYLKCLIDQPFDETTPTQFFLAKIDNEIVGSCGMHIDRDGCVGLYSDAIKRKYRKRGLGRYLIYERLKRAHSFGAKTATAQCITDDGEGVYKKVGFSMKTKLYNFVIR